MIQKATFLRVSLRARGRRRMLVGVYYALLLVVLAVGLWRPRFFASMFVAQTFILGSFFGGIRRDGVVKPYSDRTPPLDLDSTVQQLHLSGVRSQFSTQALDERERQERDHAHFVAYRLLIVLIFPLALVFVTLADLAPVYLGRTALPILWFVAVVVLSLPQSVILWTEPEPLPDVEPGPARAAVTS